MARPDLVPGPGQATGGWQAVLVAGLGQRRLRLLPKDHNEVAVQGLPDVGHKPSAVGVKPTQRQFLGVLGYVFRNGFIDLEAQQVGGLGYLELAYSRRRHKPRQRLFSLAQQHPAWPRRRTRETGSRLS